MITEENHEKTPVRLVSTGIRTRDLPNASLVRYHGATSLGSFLPSSFIYPPQSRIYTPGTYNPNARGSDACRGSNSLWTRTLDRYTTAGLPECVVSTMSGPPPETTHGRTQTKDTHPIPGQILKFRESNLGHRVGRQGLYRPRHGDGWPGF